MDLGVHPALAKTTDAPGALKVPTGILTGLVSLESRTARL